MRARKRAAVLGAFRAFPDVVRLLACKQRCRPKDIRAHGTSATPLTSTLHRYTHTSSRLPCEIVPSHAARLGTIDYLAPEILDCPVKHHPDDHKDRPETGYTNRVDCWSVGVLAYELLVGTPPFAAVSGARQHAGGHAGVAFGVCWKVRAHACRGDYAQCL